MFRLFTPANRPHHRRPRPNRPVHSPRIESLEYRWLLNGDEFLLAPASLPDTSYDFVEVSPVESPEPSEPAIEVSEPPSDTLEPISQVDPWASSTEMEPPQEGDEPLPLPTDLLLDVYDFVEVTSVESLVPSESASESSAPQPGDDLEPIGPADPGFSSTGLEATQEGNGSPPPSVPPPVGSDDAGGLPPVESTEAPESAGAVTRADGDPAPIAQADPAAGSNPAGQQATAGADLTMAASPRATSGPQPNPAHGPIGNLGSFISSIGSDELWDVKRRLTTLQTTTIAYSSGQYTNPLQGNHIVVDGTTLSSSQYVGTSGAQTCIGLVVRDSNQRIYVFHFQAGDDVASTMASAFVGLGTYATAGICGGDNTLVSNQTLEEVLSALYGYTSIHIAGFSDTPGLWIGQSGGFLVRESDVATSEDNLPPRPPPTQMPPGWPPAY